MANATAAATVAVPAAVLTNATLNGSNHSALGLILFLQTDLLRLNGLRVLNEQ